MLLVFFLIPLAIAALCLFFGGTRSNIPLWITGVMLILGMGMLFQYGGQTISVYNGQDKNSTMSYIYGNYYDCNQSCIVDINYITTTETARDVYTDVNISTDPLLNVSTMFFVYVGGIVGILATFGMLWRNFGK